MSEETSIGWQGGRKLHFNGTITYRSAVPGAINPDAPAQPASKGPYTAKIVDFAELFHLPRCRTKPLDFLFAVIVMYRSAYETAQPTLLHIQACRA
jgi:hypothetical protein